MSAQKARHRLPVSCEPCRVRKIRCTRDTPPCATCVRRRIPLEQCVYATSRQPRVSSKAHLQSRQQQARPEIPKSPEAPLPSRQDGTGQSNADLLARIENLEQLLHAKNQLHSIDSPQATVPSIHLAEEVSWGSPPPKASAGILIPSTSGHVRFLPVTSSWRIIQRGSQDGTFPNQESAVTDTPSGPYPFGEHDTENQPNLLAKLPPAEYCDQLKDIYFRSFAPLFPVLHGPTFHSQYSEFSENSQQTSLSWLALLFTILGTAVLALEHDNHLLKSLSRKATPWDRVTEITEKYHTAAMRCLEADRYLWQHNISTLQALLILIYGIHHSHGQTWSLLGLVVDPATFRLDIVEAEERRRAWLALTTLLCNQNLTMTGFDIYPSVFSSRVLPPAEVYDESIVRGQPVPIERSPGSTPVSYLVRKSHLFRIYSKISNPILVTQPGNSPALHRLDGAIRMELNSLEQSYASNIELNLSIVHTNLLLSFTHHLVLLLHSAALSDLNSNLPQHRWSKQRCVESAQRVLELHADFYRLPQFTPFQWYIRGRGSFHAFHAAFLLVFIVSTHPEEPCFLNILRLLHECHARLEASRPQSQLCTRTANILGHILSSRFVNTLERVSGGLDGDESMAVSQHGSNVETNTMNGGNSQDSLFSDIIDFPNLVRHLDPQQWTNPINMDWDQWDPIIASLGTAP